MQSCLWIKRDNEIPTCCADFFFKYYLIYILKNIILLITYLFLYLNYYFFKSLFILSS